MPDEPKPFRCTVCEILRERDTNHWWVVLLRQADSPGEFIELRQWNSVLARRAMNGGPGNAFIYLACGLRCLMTLAGRMADEVVLRHTEIPNQEKEKANAD